MDRPKRMSAFNHPSDPASGRIGGGTPSRSVLQWAIWIWIGCLCATAGKASSLVTQTFSLRSGWNAIWIEVEPTNAAIASVFGALPVESAWTFKARDAALDYIQDASEPIWNRDRWMSWVPANRPESLANNLFVVTRHRPYLLKLTAPATLTVTGTPALRVLPWVPDAYNLRGFPVDAGAPPTFQQFFSASTAHYDAGAGRIQPMYRLASDGSWERVNGTDSMDHGTAYWVFSKGGSDSMAPFSARLVLGGATLDYGLETSEYELRTENHRGSAISATIGELGAPGPTVLLKAGTTVTGLRAWDVMPALHSQSLAGGASKEVSIAVNRLSMTALSYDSVLEIRDNAGTRFLAPVSVRRRSLGAPTAQSSVGLWLGVVEVSGVNEVHSGTLQTNRLDTDLTPLEIVRTGVSATTRPTRSSFNLRLIVHVDSNGTARLLKEVTQMWKDGTYAVNGEGQQVIATPGRYVLVTNPAKFSEYKGIASRDDALTGRRLSSVGFDFPGSGPGNTNNFLPLTGNFVVNGFVTGSINLSPDFATNPFKHKYHPDHDNFGPLTERPLRYREEAFPITREIRLEFAATDPGGGVAVADYGYNHIAGVYRETVTGLHREPIRVSGVFRLKRIAEIGDLNP